MSKSKKIHPEDLETARQIKAAREFSASLILGPHDRRVARGLATYEAAREAADEMEKSSKFGRRAVIYAVCPRGSFPCTPELMELAAQI